jgi:type I restriction enzyme S subunit
MKTSENQERPSVGQQQGAAMKAGWQKKKLSELYKIGSSKRVLQSQWTTSGVPFYRGREVTRLAADGFVDNELFISEEHFAELSKEYGVPKAADIVITAIGTIGNAHVVRSSDRFYFKDASVLWMKRTADVSSEFVNLWLKSPSFFDQLDRGNGATVDTLTIQKLQSVELALPPLAEQERIVGVLDEAFAGLATAQAHAEQNLKNARALFDSHLHAVFTQRGPGWVETKVGEIGKVSMCKRIFKEETTATGDIPFYKIGTFGKEPDAFIPNSTYTEYRAKYPFPKKGDVLISASGTIGRRVRYDGEHAYFQDSNIVWINNDEKQVLNDYLYHFYGACDWNSTKGATIARLYNDNLRQIAIAFPESLHEQRRGVAQLESLSAETQRLAGLYEQKLAALAALKKSLLHQAFSGAL